MINSQVPDARSRFNTIFAAHVWGGNATGALLATVALAHAGWLAVCAIGFVAASCGLVLQRRAAAGVAASGDPIPLLERGGGGGSAGVVTVAPGW